MDHKGESDVLDSAIQYCSNRVVPLEFANIQKYLPHTISKAQDATPVEIDSPETQQAAHQ